MPKIHSSAKLRTARLAAQWADMPEDRLTALGLDLPTLVAAQAGLAGHIVLPGDPGYDDDRMLSNPVFSPQPAMIVYCASEADVATALRLARRGAMPFTVRSGGHCTAGYSGGYGVMIDLSLMNGVTVEPAARLAVVGAGCNFDKLNKTLAGYRDADGAQLHLPAGECGDVCVGGFVQGGGLGFTSASFGMNCDNVVQMRVMLADGRIVTASEDENHDLWWAMRGGTGGNFGVLLWVVYRLRWLRPVLGLAAAWDVSTPAGIAQATRAMALLQQDYMGPGAVTPDLNLQVLVVWQTILDPAKPPLPQPIPVFMIRALYVGDPPAGKAAFQPILELPGAVSQFAIVDDYDSVLNALLSNPQDQPIIDPAMGMPNEGKASRYVARDLSPAEWQEILTYFTTKTPSTLSYMYLECYGGAIARYPREASAFIHRDALYDAVLDVFWYKPADRAAAEAFMAGWTRFFDRVGNGQSYQNYPAVTVPDYPLAYWAEATHGLILTKRKYDPEQAFTFAQRIPAELTPEIAGQPVPPKVAAALKQPIRY